MAHPPLHELVRVEDSTSLADRVQRFAIHGAGAVLGIGGVVALFEPFGIKADALGWAGLAAVGAAAACYGAGVQLASRAMAYHRVFVAAREFRAPGPTQHLELLRTFDDVQHALRATVDEAEGVLVTTGSRSRDVPYMKAIENKLASCPRVVHYRVLFGAPFHANFKTHLVNLVSLRCAGDRTAGFQTLFIGLFEDDFHESEKFVVANEKSAVIILPSLTGIGQYDTALYVRDAEFARAYLGYVRTLYAASRKLATEEEVAALSVRRAPTP